MSIVLRQPPLSATVQPIDESILTSTTNKMGIFQVPLLVGPIGRGFVECFVLLLISEINALSSVRPVIETHNLDDLM